MHYLTLVTVDIPEIEEDFKENDRVRQAILKMKLIKKHRFEKLGKEPPLMMDINISNTQAMCSSFARAVDAAVWDVMEPYSENTEDPEYLEFDDRTDEAKEEYLTENSLMIHLPNGSYVNPHSSSFYNQFSIKNNLVYEKNVGPCKHDKRTKRAKKMTVVNLPYRRQYKTFDDYAKDIYPHTVEGNEKRYGYYYNPNAFWDWYEIGGRWPREFLVKDTCIAFADGVRRHDETLSSAPVGYRWVSAARKKDIAWDMMQKWHRKEAVASFYRLQKAYADKKLPEHCYGTFTDEGICGFREMIYIKDETLVDYLKRNNLYEAEKYGFHPYAYLDENGWNTHERICISEDKPKLVEADGWYHDLNKFIDSLSDDTVLVAVDNHN